MNSKILVSAFLLFTIFSSFAQNLSFSRQDSLRGSITPEREWWDLKYYHLDIKVDPDQKSIEGSVTVDYEVIKAKNHLQIDLQEPLKITKVLDDEGKPLLFKKDGNAHFINLRQTPEVGSRHSIKVFYSGQPKIAVRPPWDGGISWDKDENGKHRVHSSCQGIGASIWWPNKDHMADEPDSVLISVNVPEGLMNVSNGMLRSEEKMSDGSKTFHWFVSNPISNYGININIGDYVKFSDVYKGLKGDLPMDYYVLPENLEKAKIQFKDAPRMMEAFEYWFGPYPFYEDGFKLVDATYLGMEHQSSITYGNGFQNGYRGTDLSDTGWGLKFDFIIIHESGHEWFANNITYKDVADMWIHESFTNYSESLFLEYFWDKKIGQEYVRGTRKRIQNDGPIIGFYNVNKSGSGDMYYKGGNMLNTIRTVLNDDVLWRKVLLGLNKEFYHQTVTTQQIESYISTQTNLDLSKVFDQYLRDYRVPVFEYYTKEGKLYFRWSHTVKGFDMPMDLISESNSERIFPLQGKWSSIDFTSDEVRIDPNYYISVLRTQ